MNTFVKDFVDLIGRPSVIFKGDKLSTWLQLFFFNYDKSIGSSNLGMKFLFRFCSISRISTSKSQ